MGNRQRALEIIETAKKEGSRQLNLGGIGLTSEDIQALMPEIIKIQDLQKLKLSDNKLVNLPDELGELTSLTELHLGKNSISEIPSSLGKLTNLRVFEAASNNLSVLPDSFVDLESLELLNLDSNGLTLLPDQIGNLATLIDLNLSNNHLSHLPESIGELVKLERLFASNNRLTTIPGTLVNCANLEELLLTRNPLTEEALTWISDTFGYDIVDADMAANEQLEQIEVVLEKLYGKTADEKHDKMEEMEWGSFVTDLNENKTAKEVLETFIPLIPLNDPFTESIYIPTVKNLLNRVFDNDAAPQEKNEVLQMMATSLGNCATPVRSFLIQRAIGEMTGLKGEMPENLKGIIEREAFEKNIDLKLTKYLAKNEKIEQVQGLLNSLFLEEAENHPHNPLKIYGDRRRIPSKTNHIDFAFQMISDSLAKAFALTCCKTDLEGKLITNEDGTYNLDAQKFRLVVEEYMADLGILSERERLINHFEKEIAASIRSFELEMHMDNPEVLPVLKMNEQKNELRELLNRTPDNTIDDVFNGFLEVRKEAVNEIGKKIRPEKKMAEMARPLNLERQESSSSENDGEKRKSFSKPMENTKIKRTRSHK